MEHLWLKQSNSNRNLLASISLIKRSYSILNPPLKIVNTTGENAKTLITFIVYIIQELSNGQRHYLLRPCVAMLESMHTLSLLCSKFPLILLYDLRPLTYEYSLNRFENYYLIYYVGCHRYRITLLMK